MPEINFCFQGHITLADVTTATDINGKEVDVSNMAPHELAERLESGDLFISLGDYLYENSKDAHIEMFDFEGED
jgi:hypothetical protein